MTPITPESIQALSDSLKWGALGFGFSMIVLNALTVLMLLSWANQSQNRQINAMKDVFNNIISLQEQKNEALNQMVFAMNGTLGRIEQAIAGIETVCPYPGPRPPKSGDSS